MSLNMIDKKVVFEKKDVNGNVLEGAELQVIDAETEEIVDTWITSEAVSYTHLDVYKRQS